MDNTHHVEACRINMDLSVENVHGHIDGTICTQVLLTGVAVAVAAQGQF